MKCLECKNYWTNGKDESCDVRGWDFVRDGCPDYQSKQKPKTNADRIRSMTDEELAEVAVSTGQGCAPGKNFVECCFDHKDGLIEADCRKCWLNFLKEEVEA